MFPSRVYVGFCNVNTRDQYGLLILDYAGIAWGDKSNMTLNKVQVLQDTAAKIVLGRPKNSSSTEVLDQLGRVNIAIRRSFHRLVLFFKALNGLRTFARKFSTR